MRGDTWRPDEPVSAGVPIGAAARRFLQVRGFGSTVTLADVMTTWPELVGETVARQAKPVALRRSLLVVEVSEPAWATELQFRSAAILGRLAERLGESSPSEISVRVSRHGATRPPSGGQAGPPSG
ncbi:MAG TPA: DUF721 domain-containing protein [Acidimicrobiales bacterium]|nr:DUF721 domain-containing protein [Acidimicrobiales bacterium]